MPRLSDIGLKNLAPPSAGRLTIWDEGSPLGVRVTSNGVKTFIVMLGSGKRHAIGRYGVVTLSQAREAARRLKAEKTLGRIFPIAVSVSEAREAYLAQLDVRDNTRLYYERNLNRLEAGKLTDITMRDINRALSGLGPTSSSQALASLRAFLRWCARPPQNYLPRSPLEGLRLNGTKSRKRVLDDDELKHVWNAALEQGYPHGTICQLLILTGQRRGEIANLRRQWINKNARTITLPSWATKNGKEHTFPYGHMVAAIFDTIPVDKSTALLFPSRVSGERPLSGWSKYKNELEDGVAGWTLHDLRRTYRTIHARIGTLPEIGERLINHVSAVATDVELIYDRYTYMPEMKVAIQNFEANFARIIETALPQLERPAAALHAGHRSADPS